ncbi:MAG: hypothetical protein HZA01_16810 [Nitrospinae bacterium]|nr:hypothetical protein [Nitrospinota bacterium]
MGKAGQKKLTENELTELLSGFKFEFLYLECVEEARLEHFQFDGSGFTLREGTVSSLNNWHRGAAFGPEREVRWERTGEPYYNTLFLTEPDQLFPEGWEVRDLSDFESETREFFLWGGYNKELKCWEEGSIPKALHYPLDSEKSPSPRLQIKEYSRLYWEGNQVREESFHRFVKLF